MSVSLKLLHKSSGEVHEVRFEFNFIKTNIFKGVFPIEIQDFKTGTHYYYSTLEKLAKEWEFPGGEDE